MKNKLLIALLIGLLIFSGLSMALATTAKCPTCNSLGEIQCPKCDGTGYVGEAENVECSRCNGTGQVKPSLLLSSMTADVTASTTDITAVYINREDSEVNASITANLEDHSVNSDTTAFPPGEGVTVELSIPYVSTYSSISLLNHIEMTVNADTIICSYCNETGIITEGTFCAKCDGSGKIVCPDCGGSGYITEGVVVNSSKNSGTDWTLIGTIVGVIVVVAVIGVLGFVLIKKRRVSEDNLKRLSSSEFQHWVLKRLDGKPGSSKDSAMGIDGFSRLNLPISIKQVDAVGMNAIDLFAASLAKYRATGGILVAFGFGDDAIRGKVRARTNYRLDIDMLTVRELLERRTSY